MSYFPCESFISCPGNEAELPAARNFSAEGVDVFSAFGEFQCSRVGDNPAFNTCRSPKSQEAADLCAARCIHSGLFVNTEQTCEGCSVTITQAAGTVLGLSQANADALAHSLACLGVNTVCVVSNSPQSCTVDCASGPFTYTVPAGQFTAPTQQAADNIARQVACANAAICGLGVFNAAQSCTVFCAQTNQNITQTVQAGVIYGATQAEADAAANAIACALAGIACQAMPAQFTNTTQTCTQTCNGVEVSFTILEGALIGDSQENANNLALLFACQVLSEACQEDRLPPEPVNVGNTLQVAQITCASGGVFNFVVPPGTFRLENREAANAAALSYGESRAWAVYFCLPDITANVCAGDIYAASITPEGPGASNFIALQSGTLPPGIMLDGDMLFGVPTTAGTYTFTILAGDADGNYTTRTYTITVQVILTDTLPDGALATAYNQSVVVAGFSNPFFSVVGGALPPGLSLNSSTGAISGVPTLSGNYSFVIDVEEG